MFILCIYLIFYSFGFQYWKMIKQCLFNHKEIKTRGIKSSIHHSYENERLHHKIIKNIEMQFLMNNLILDFVPLGLIF